MRKRTFSINLDVTDCQILQKLAEDSDRSKSAVLRRLLSLAELPEIRSFMLGINAPAKEEHLHDEA